LLFYESFIKSVPQVRLFSAAIPSYVNSKLKSVFVNFYIESGYVIVLMLVTIFVRFYHAGTVCTRRRARLLVCFDRHVGWKQTVKLRLIKLFNLTALQRRRAGAGAVAAALMMCGRGEIGRKLRLHEWLDALPPRHRCMLGFA